jgi:hypothetical protein
MAPEIDQLREASFVTIGSTLVSYSLILLVMFLVLFVVPFAVFLVL